MAKHGGRKRAINRALTTIHKDGRPVVYIRRPGEKLYTLCRD